MDVLVQEPERHHGVKRLNERIEIDDFDRGRLGRLHAQGPERQRAMAAGVATHVFDPMLDLDFDVGDLGSRR